MNLVCHKPRWTVPWEVQPRVSRISWMNHHAFDQNNTETNDLIQSFELTHELIFLMELDHFIIDILTPRGPYFLEKYLLLIMGP